MNITKVFAIVATVLMLGCQFVGSQGRSLEDNATIKSGWSFGMCAGYCRASLEYNADSVSVILTSQLPLGGGPPDILYKEPMESNQWHALQRSANLDSFCNLDEVLGCPDCADGGAEWVELECDGKEKKVTFEFKSTPSGMEDLLREIRPLRDSLVARAQSQTQ